MVYIGSYQNTYGTVCIGVCIDNFGLDGWTTGRRFL